MDDNIERAELARIGSPYLDTAQAAHYLSLSVRTMERMRRKGTGPTPRRHTRKVHYHIDDLDSWARARATETGA